MHNKKNTNLFIALGGLFVVIIGAWYILENTAPMNQGENNSQAEISTEDTTTGSIHATPGAAPLTYTQALKVYKNARIQLDKDCRADVTNSTYKNGASIMIDNRSAVARTVKLGSVFPIKAWGFKIVKLSSATLPATWYLDCGNSQNVATVLIQK